MSTTSIRLLLVEDEPGDAALVKRQLMNSMEADFDVLHVGTVERAREELRGGDPFDAVLADLNLPDSDGAKTVARLTDASPRTPVVVLTDAQDTKTRDDVLALGAQDFVSKDELLSRSLIRGIVLAVSRGRFQAGMLNIEDLERQLTHADRLASIGQLAAGVAHEINNPATYIDANCQQIRVELDALAARVEQDIEAIRVQLRDLGHDPLQLLSTLEWHEEFRSLHALAAESQEGIQRVISIVRALGMFARIEQDEVQLGDPNEILEIAYTMVRNELRHRCVFVRDLQPLPTIPLHRAKMTQVFVNLLINASHALGETVEDNQVTVRSSVVDGEVRIEVEDNGVGIPEDALPRIFEPFFTTKPRDTGTGLGLPISIETVRKHGGRVDVWSELGVGTRFTVIIPVETGLQPSTPPPPAPAQTPCTSGRVLVIDDDAFVRQPHIPPRTSATGTRKASSQRRAARYGRRGCTAGFIQLTRGVTRRQARSLTGPGTQTGDHLESRKSALR